MNIAVSGTEYVRMSITILLAQHNHVYAVNVILEKVGLLNLGKSPIQDEYIEEYLTSRDADDHPIHLDLTAAYGGTTEYKVRTMRLSPLLPTTTQRRLLLYRQHGASH